MTALPKDQLLRLQEENGYGIMRVVDGDGKGLEALWAASWPPPEHALLIVPSLHTPQLVEIPEEPEHLSSLREGVTFGWRIFEMIRGNHSNISDEDAKSMTRVIRIAEYRQGEVFEP